MNYFVDNLLRKIGIDAVDNREFRNSINLSIREMGISFGEQLPYHKSIIDGITYYNWSPDFIDRLLYVLSTDDDSILNKYGKYEFDNLILFEDNHTHSATLDGNNIGCTIPVNSLSYVVDNTGITFELCNEPLYDSENEALYASLDKALMDIYNCIDKDTQKVLYEGLEDVSPCL